MNTNRSTQFSSRARHTVLRFRHGGIDYETTMNLLTEHAYRVQRMNPKVAGGTAAQAIALSDIYSLMEWVQTRAPIFVEPVMGELMDPLGDANYVTRPATVNY